MKDILKSAIGKILSVILVVALLAGGVYFAYHHFLGKGAESFSNQTTDQVEVVKEKLKTTAELNTGSYLCTNVLTKSDSKTFKDWEIPLTTKSFIVSYDGTVKAGIKDLTDAQVVRDGDVIVVRLPEVEITGAEIDNDSFALIDESNNIFNPISIEDLNSAQKELKEKMIEDAKEKGILDMARSNAEMIISAMLESPNGAYKVRIEWQ